MSELGQNRPIKGGGRECPILLQSDVHSAVSERVGGQEETFGGNLQNYDSVTFPLNI